MGQLPKLRADTVCHVNTFTDTSGISLQHWRLYLGFQQDFGGGSGFVHEPTRRKRGANSQASSSGPWTRTRADSTLLCFYVICCVILASVAVLVVFPASASAGPDHTFASFYRLFGRLKFLHLYKIGSLTATGWADRLSALSVFFFQHVVSQGAPNSKVVRSRESVRTPGVLSTLALRASWLVGGRRQYLIGSGGILVCGWLRCCRRISDWVVVDCASREACGGTRGRICGLLCGLPGARDGGSWQQGGW